MKKEILKLIDANTNRLREALRVCEDISRFVLSDGRSARELKRIRHASTRAAEKMAGDGRTLEKSRYPEKDVGRHSMATEVKRNSVADIFSANMKRAEESARVLEEFSKLKNASSSESFKTLRFCLYRIERNVIKKL